LNEFLWSWWRGCRRGLGGRWIFAWAFKLTKNVDDGNVQSVGGGGENGRDADKGAALTGFENVVQLLE